MTAIEPYKDTLSQPDVLNTSHKLAQQIANTDFVPKQFRGKPEAVMAALLTGRELGLGPMTALQRIHVIEGKPALDAQGQRALVLAAGHDMWITESTPDRCTVTGRRNGSSHEQSVTWTLAEARAAGLTNKSNWKSYPRQMLQARATAELARLIAPDALGGVAYTVEELEDTQPTVVTRAARRSAAEPAVDAVQVTTKATVPPPRADPAPSWDDDEPVDAEIVPAEPAAEPEQQQLAAPRDPAATPNQVKMAMAISRGLGLDDDARHALISVASNGRTEKITELTRPEISALIDQLKAEQQPAAKADYPPGEEPF